MLKHQAKPPPPQWGGVFPQGDDMSAKHTPGPWSVGSHRQSHRRAAMTYFNGLCVSAVFLLWICADAITNYVTNGMLA